MEIKKNYNLSKLNTFGININAAFFVEIKSEAELIELLKMPQFKQSKKMFLGGGETEAVLKTAQQEPRTVCRQESLGCQ